MMTLNCSATVPEVCLSSCTCGTPVDPVAEPVNYDENVGIAFAIVTGAGLSTTFGAALVFCNRCVTRTNHKILGASLGFSSGVMLYVSFVEILQKAVISFTDCECLWSSQTNENAAYTAATLCFFGGVAVVFLLDLLVHALSKKGGGHGHSHGPELFNESVERRETNAETERTPDQKATSVAAISPAQNTNYKSAVNLDDFVIEDETSSDESHQHAAAQDPDEFLDKTLSRSVVEADHRKSLADEDAIYDLEKQMSRRMQEEEDLPSFTNKTSSLKLNRFAQEESKTPLRTTRLTAQEPLISDQSNVAHSHGHGHSQNTGHHGHHHHHGHDHQEHDDLNKLNDSEESAKLAHMGLMTALAIGLHNFPEGLATFVAALSNPQVGGALAVAIAIHNIPEGLCVSVPIYYATGSRWKGFWMAFFSGVTEIIGAAIGYGFLMAIMGPAAYAVLFGLVSGMMVTIVAKELLPTAHRYDAHDKVVTLSIFMGMAVIALSLVLFRV